MAAVRAVLGINGSSVTGLIGGACCTVDGGGGRAGGTGVGPAAATSAPPSPQAPSPPVPAQIVPPPASASAAPSPPPAAAAPQMAAVQPGTFGAWLISMDSEAAAQGFLRVAQAKNPTFFAEAPAAIMPVRYEGGRVYYRVVAGEHPSRAAAAAACRRLQELDPGAFCKVVVN